MILKVVAFSLAKKVVVYLVAKQYGFRRLYRRISKFNHSVNRESPMLRTRMRNQLQFAFRLPGKLYQRVQRWRGVQVPPSAPPAPSHGTTHSHPQQKQVREIHTRSTALRVSSLNVPNPSSSAFGSVSHSPQTHPLGRRGAGNEIASFNRPFSSSLLPFGISSLVSPSKALQASSGHFISPAGHGVLIKPDSVRTTLDIEHFFQSCGLLRASKHAFRSGIMIDESRNLVRKSVGLSLLL